MTINIHEFSKQFAKEYEFLYDNRDRVAGYEETVYAFDQFVETNGDFVGAFAQYRQDYITSDREAAAFMFALDAMGAL